MQGGKVGKEVSNLCLADLSKNFSQLVVSIFVFSQYFFQLVLLGRKVWVTSHCLYRDSLILTILAKQASS